MSQDNEKEEQKWLLDKTGLSSLGDLTRLTKLDLPNCGLSELPANLPTLLPNLSILFCPKNNFEELPPIIGACPNLQMVSFKDNGMEKIHPDALQPQLRWLILTGNDISEIPETIGRCTKLQKLMLSGNQLTAMPDSVDQLQNLELVRLACNNISEPPMKLLQLPNLRWVAFSGNPFLMDAKSSRLQEPPVIEDAVLQDPAWPILGQGAGGVTRKVTWNDNPVAVKEFAGELTSDGSPQDERAISVQAASLHDASLIQLFGQTPNGSLVMEFLDGFDALAGPPSFETCSRDVYSENNNTNISETFAWEIATKLLGVLSKLHEKGICHGDFYAHNILISSSDVKLSDFGAAFFYDTQSEYGALVHSIEVRAWQVLVEELFTLVMNNSNEPQKDWKGLLEAGQSGKTRFPDLANQFL